MTTHDTPAVRIVARRDGFRRMGIAHSAAPVDHPAGTFSADEIRALEAEPELIITVDPTPTPGSGGASSTGEAPPDPDAHRAARIAAAVAVLDPAIKKDWTRGGKPLTTAVERDTGLKDVSGAERDTAWAIIRRAVERHAPKPDAGDGGGKEDPAKKDPEAGKDAD